MKTIRLPNYSRCFVCGHGNPRGLNVRFDTDGTRVWTSFVATQEQMGYHGVVHGGVLSALLDECMGWSACVKRGVFFLAAEITVRFLKPVPLGINLTVEAEVTADRGRLCDAKGQIVDQASNVYVSAKGKFFPMSQAETDRIIAYLSSESETEWPDDLRRLSP